MEKKVQLTKDWYSLLADEFNQAYFSQLRSFVHSEYRDHLVYPPAKYIFRAFDSCPLDNVKIVILGQDPYHGAGQANGLSFSVARDLRCPPSLINIFKELSACGYPQDFSNGDLSRWAKQGVFLLNSVLTVRACHAGSHANRGWEIFTDAVIRKLNQHKTGLVYMLWGAYAQKKAYFVDPDKNLILRAPHPSPLAAHRGFFGCKHFSLANSYLDKPIQW